MGIYEFHPLDFPAMFLAGFSPKRSRKGVLVLPPDEEEAMASHEGVNGMNERWAGGGGGGGMGPSILVVCLFQSSRQRIPV